MNSYFIFIALVARISFADTSDYWKEFLIFDYTADTIYIFDSFIVSRKGKTNFENFCNCAL
jgi:hypothetical protein